MRWGERLEFTAERGPATSSTCRPTFHTRRSTPSETEPLECVLVRSDNEAVATYIDITPAEKVEEVYWVDPTHPSPAQALTRSVSVGGRQRIHMRESPRRAE